MKRRKAVWGPDYVSGMMFRPADMTSKTAGGKFDLSDSAHTVTGDGYTWRRLLRYEVCHPGCMFLDEVIRA